MKFQQIVLGLGILWIGATVHAQDSSQYEQPPISYSTTEPRDVVRRLEARLKAGELNFSGENKEVLRHVLGELGIPIESQMLVFSKTSLQRTKISPERPRAIYFSDDCYVGWVQGWLIEVTTIDATLGPVFYSFDPNLTKTSQPKFVRDNDCLRCHGGSMVRNMPGVLARSVFADEDGEPLLRHGSEMVDYRTPFESRWGGWYVTGKHGEALHRGNITAQEKKEELITDFTRGANIEDLSPFFDKEKYLTGTSDIVALMIFEHQIATHNALTRAAFNCRRMLEYQKNLQRDLKEPETDEPTYASVKSVFESATQDVVDHLLFREEAALPSGIEGSKSFQEAFARNARRAKDGSSLKDLRLKEHLFNNRCSYLIYSEFFLSLPETLKKRIYARLGKALHSTSPDPRYEYLDAEERARIVGILRETHPDLSNGLPE